MKKLIALLLFAVPLWAQNVSEVVVKPLIFTATIDSIVVTLGNDTVSTVATAKFASVVVGQTVWGNGIPFGTTVEALPDTSVDSVLVLSKAASETDTLATLNFSYYQASGGFVNDFIGLFFEIPNAQGKTLSSVTLLDSSDAVDDSLEVLLFNNPDYAASPVLDTANVSTVNTDFDNVLGNVLFTKMRDLGAVRLMQETGLDLPMSNDRVYGRLVNRSSTRVLCKSTQAIILRFKFVY